MVKIAEKFLGDELELIYGKGLVKSKRIEGQYFVYGSNGVVGTHNEFIFEGPGIIIGRKGTVGSVTYSKNNFWAIDTTYVLQLKSENDYLKFWYYFLQTLNLKNMNVHSAVPGLNRENFYKLKVNVIQNFEERRKISKILSLLDEKIEINRKINENLEEQAKEIFKRWFVDYEFPNKEGQPYKSSDGEIIESELGLIPKGWKIEILNKYIKFIDNRGKTPPLSKIKTNYPIIDVKALSGNFRIIDYGMCTKYVDELTYNEWFRSGHPKPLDILFSTVGSLAEMKLFYGNIGCIAQNVIGLRITNLSPLYLYQYLSYIKNDLISYNIGSVQPSIKVTHIANHNILIPDEVTLEHFNILANSISNIIYSNFIQIQKLSSLRDILLPKLMTGEIDVSKIDI